MHFQELIITGNQKEYYLVPADEIYGVDDFGQGDDFWNHHGNTKEDYMSLAENLPEVNERISNGESLESLQNNPELKDCANAYYGPDKMVKVNATEDGYEFNSDGRHRVMAAQEAGCEIPVEVQNPEAMNREPDNYKIHNENLDENQSNQSDMKEKNMGERERFHNDSDEYYSDLTEKEQSDEYTRKPDNTREQNQAVGKKALDAYNLDKGNSSDNANDLTSESNNNWDGSGVKIPHDNSQSNQQNADASELTAPQNDQSQNQSQNLDNDQSQKNGYSY